MSASTPRHPRPSANATAKPLYLTSSRSVSSGLSRSGRLRSMTGKKFPRALGTDFAGVVEAAGPGVITFRVGDEVLGGAPLKSSGAFGDLVVTDLKTVVR